MIEFVFLDMDDTILDFHRSEREAIPRVLRHFGIEATEEIIGRYHIINLEHWRRLERGEITREQISNRFDVLFRELGVEGDTQTCERLYQQFLSEGCHFMPGALEAVKGLSRKYRLFLATNGTKSVQDSRISRAGLKEYFEGIFISEEMGANKPDVRFFQRAFSTIADLDKSRAIMVGDSLTSDILGGIHGGLATCWVNPAHAPAPDHIRPDHQIESITQLEALLESL